MKGNIVLFLLICGLNGIFVFLGSVLGNAFGKAGLFAGAVIGGVLGIAVAVWLAQRAGLLEGARYIAVFLAAVAGFTIAAVLAVLNLSGPIIPMLSVGIVGLAAVAGKMWDRRG